ncbi:MAG TPA: hypothetical protein VMW01_00265 [Williamwhitmania sp.]|nr:hypothetical protein [Williamwhitmania sp.]
MKKIALFIPLLILIGCSGSENNNSNSTSNKSNSAAAQVKQLNISILLDLSDRIDINKYPEKPEHFARDIANVKYITELFAKDMEKRGAFMSKGKLRVIFSPRPLDPNVNILAEKLNIDLSKMDNKQKKVVHDTISTTFIDNLTKIYNSAISAHKWIGSDIWRFFKNDVKDYCIDNDSTYRNILIILTDGYIYHADSKDQAGNRFAYLLPELITKYQLRNNPNWEQTINKLDFGLITKRNDLNNLEILVLEITPSPVYKDDEDIIKDVLSKWFKEMQVKRFALYNSDLPEYTKQRISDFMK